MCETSFRCEVSFDHSAARRGISPPAGGDLLFPWRKRRQNAPGDASDGLRLRCAPPRSIGRFPRTPFTGDALLLIYCWISGAQNLSGGSKFLPGHWALGVQNLKLLRFKNCACVCLADAFGPFSTVGAAFGRPQAFPPGVPQRPDEEMLLNPNPYPGGSPKGLPYPGKELILGLCRGGTLGRSGTGPYEANGTGPVSA